MPNGRRESRRTGLVVVLLLAFALAAWVASPLWVGLVLGLVIGFTAQPVYERLLARLHGRRILASALVTLGAGIVCVAIGAALVYVVVDQLVAFVRLVEQRIAATTSSTMVGPRGERVLEHLGMSQAEVVDRLRSAVQDAARSVATAAGVAAAAITHGVLDLFLALLTTYYVLLEWGTVAHRLETVLPIEPRYTRALMTELRDVGRGALVGTVVTGAVQGVLAAIGCWISGVSSPAAWGTLTFLTSFVPLVGTSAVWLPIGVYLLYQGRVFAGVFELLWGALVVMALSDYVIRPRLVGNAGHGHPLLVLVSILGGLEVMGLAGLVVGPILMALFVAVLRIYEREAARSALGRPPQSST
jgi:predicted PurR-regulated permease PerM